MEFLIWLFSSSSRIFFAAVGVLIAGSWIGRTAVAKHMSNDIMVSIYADLMQPVGSALTSAGLGMLAIAAAVFVLEQVRD